MRTRIRGNRRIRTIRSNIRQFRGSGRSTRELSDNSKNTRSEEKAHQPPRTAQESAESSLVPYNPRLLNRAHTRLQLGDWEQLAELDAHELAHNPASAELRLLAAAGHLQRGGDQSKARARDLIESAIGAGMSRESVARMLIGGASNTLGRIAALSERPDKKIMHHFRAAIDIAVPDADTDLLLQPMVTRQLARLARASGSDTLREMAQRTTLSDIHQSDRYCKTTDGAKVRGGGALFVLPVTVEGSVLQLEIVIDDSRPFCRQEDGVEFDLDNGARIYVVSNPSGDFRTAHGTGCFRLAPETLYALSGNIEFEGETAPIVWIFGYSKDELVFKKPFPVRQGQLKGEFWVENEALDASIGFRLAGSGSIRATGSYLQLDIKQKGQTGPAVNQYNRLRLPKTKSDKQAGRIKVFGTFRSGTNFLRALIEWNFNGEVIFSEIGGWKHSPITDAARSQMIDHQLGCVCIVKHPLSSLVSWFNYARNVGLNIECAEDWNDFLSSRFVIFDAGQNSAHSEYRFSQPADYWNQMTWNQLSFARQNADMAYLIQYEDLLDEPEKRVTELADFFQLEKINSGNEFLIPEQAVARMADKPRRHRDEYLAEQKFDKSYYQKARFYEKFSPEQLEKLRTQLDADLLKALNYKF